MLQVSKYVSPSNMSWNVAAYKHISMFPRGFQTKFCTAGAPLGNIFITAPSTKRNCADLVWLMFFHLEHVSCYLHVFSEVPRHLPTVRTVTIQPWEGSFSDDEDQDGKMQRTLHHDAVHAYQCCIALYLIMMGKKLHFASYKLCNMEDVRDKAIWSE